MRLVTMYDHLSSESTRPLQPPTGIFKAKQERGFESLFVSGHADSNKQTNQLVWGEGPLF